MNTDAAALNARHRNRNGSVVETDRLTQFSVVKGLRTREKEKKKTISFESQLVRRDIFRHETFQINQRISGISWAWKTRREMSRVIKNTFATLAEGSESKR